MAATPWATVAQIKTVTGLDVTEADRAVAVSTLETLTGLIEAIDRPDISDRDRHWLKLMCAYQAAFIADNPDLFSRVDVTSASQDGESASFRNVDSHLLAPLARKAMRRLSWRALRALVPGGGVPTASTGRDVNSEAFDDALPWSSL